MAYSFIALGFNIDHVATLRQARRARAPDPVHAALAAELAGADSITLHLREDRRHIQVQDVRALKELLKTRMNLEMAVTDEMLDIARAVRPADCCLVPERRQEVTTEGGLDIIAQRKELEPTIKRLQTSGIRVSLFVDPTLEQIDAAHELGVEMVELHTGKLANAFSEKIEKQELENLQAAAKAASELKLQVNAGHGINYTNIALIHKIPHLTELNIGHSIVSRALFVGIENAIKELLGAMADYPG